ncbi:MAG: flagellar hook-basal body complex protein [Planctomycetota bacterium]
MAGSLQTAVSGMQAYQKMLSVTGNNISNANTTAYKRDRVSFAQAFASTLQAGQGPSGDSGGTNPVQMGNGVRVAGIDKDMSGGGQKSTGQTFDMAVDGRGFFAVSDGRRTLYTRDGSFGVDAENYIVDPSTGHRLQRLGKVGEAEGFQDPGDRGIRVPYDSVLPAQSTGKISFSGNLQAGEGTPTATELAAADFSYTTTSGGRADSSTPFSQVEQLQGFSSGDTIDITGRARDGSAVSGTFTYGSSNDGTTLGDLLTRIEDVFSGASTSVTASLEEGTIHVAEQDEGYSMMDLNLSCSSHDGAAPADFNYHRVGGAASHSTNITVYDPQGGSHSLSATFVRQAPEADAWDLVVNSVEGAREVTDRRVSGIKFDSRGLLQGVTETDGFGNDPAAISSVDKGLAVQFEEGGTPHAIEPDFGDVGGRQGLTQFGGESTAGAESQDGHTSGQLSDVTIEGSGIIKGRFTNGETKDMARVALATFDNPEGLARDGGNYFRATPASGAAHETSGQVGNAGKIRQGVLEESNVKISEEFTDLITAQRGFQVNARAVRVTNNVLKELANITM